MNNFATPPQKKIAVEIFYVKVNEGKFARYTNNFQLIYHFCYTKHNT